MLTILNHAIKFYGLNDNIASKLGNFPKGNEIKKMNFWTYDEYLKFINNVDDIVYKVFFETSYFTGLRKGECNALTWDDFKDGKLYINKTISKEYYDGERKINTPKTESSNRVVALDDGTIESLSA